MATFRINGIVMVDVYVEVEAETMEEAMEIAKDDVRMTEYCNGTVGAYGYYNDVVSSIDTVCSDEIEWHEEYSEEV